LVDMKDRQSKLRELSILGIGAPVKRPFFLRNPEKDEISLPGCA
jgi:hypothetical protein